MHECRHIFASLMIAAGVNLKALQTFMGHASITITLDRYGHLLPGSEAGTHGPFEVVSGLRSGDGVEPSNRGAATACRF